MTRGPGRLDIRVRAMKSGDRAAWSHMRRALWPATTREETLREIERILAAPEMWAFIAESQAPVGFAEVTLRPYANGCEQTPVPFLEGIWVAPEARGSGVGKRLIDHIIDQVLAMGFRELCSDALLDDRRSHAAHVSWGFAETERVVYFRKALS